MNGRGNSTLLRDANVLALLVAAGRTKAPVGIHRSLQRVSLPAEDVIGVLAIAGVIPSAEVKGLGAVCGPVGFVIEGCSIPDNLHTA